MDYMQAICYEIASRTFHPPSWIDPFEYAVDSLVKANADPPSLDIADPLGHCCQVRLPPFFILNEMK